MAGANWAAVMTGDNIAKVVADVRASADIKARIEILVLLLTSRVGFVVGIVSWCSPGSRRCWCVRR
jgi:hypothetical protein